MRTHIVSRIFVISPITLFRAVSKPIIIISIGKVVIYCSWQSYRGYSAFAIFLAPIMLPSPPITTRPSIWKAFSTLSAFLKPSSRLHFLTSWRFLILFHLLLLFQQRLHCLFLKLSHPIRPQYPLYIPIGVIPFNHAI